MSQQFNPNIGKDLPGTYINQESSRRPTIVVAPRGIMLLPLPDHGYGPAAEFMEINSSSPDSQIAKLGYSVYDNHPNMIMIREAFKKARTVIVYIPNEQGRTSATITVEGLTATARYGGADGDRLRFSVVANPVGGFDVTVYLGEIEDAVYEQLNTIEELSAQGNRWINFTGTGELEAIAGTQLTGGTNGTMTAQNITTFLDESETVRWNSLAFPFEPTGESSDPIVALQAAVVNKIRTLRQKTGKEVTAVLVKYSAAGDFDGIINVTNTVELSDGTELSLAQVTAWVAALDAGSTNTQSNTFEPYNGAVRVIGIKDYDASVAAVRRGEFFFTYSEEGEVVVQYDINSLTNFTAPFDKTYRKNRVRRVYDTFRESVRLTFTPNRFDNSDEDWDVIEGLGRALLLEFLDAGAITNVDFANDFKVDRARSVGDETYINIWLQATDSAEKIFVTIRTR